ncbi:MAG: TetR/AcrR family transcriptional regulator [Azospirillaceae bacterium]|nr:TetR/AcrR family transcriptional regulator [Azospirillaceae bacterium]
MTTQGTADAPDGGCAGGHKARQRKTGDTRRAEIITAALELMHEVGPGGTTTTAIAHRIGMAQGSLFRHFPTKRAMWEAVLDSLAQRVTPPIHDAVNGPGTPLVRLRRVMHTWLELAENIPALSSLMFSREVLADSPDMRALLVERLQRPHRIYCALISEGIAAGEIKADIDVERVGWILAGMKHSLVMRWTLLDRTLDMHADLDVMLDTIIAGMARR